MKEVVEAPMTFADRVRGWWDADYAARAAVARAVAARPWLSWGGRRGGTSTRTTEGWNGQPFGPGSNRTLTPTVRRNMVKRSRAIDENNLLGSSFLDRAVDNVIGNGMTLQATTEDDGWNTEAEALWAEYGGEIDSRGLVKSHGQWQRAFYRGYKRDGDIGGLLLKAGSVQAIESDYIQTPSGGGDRRQSGDPDIIDGVELGAAGRPVAFHVSNTRNAFYNASFNRVPARNMVWLMSNDRLDREAVRGAPVLAMVGDLLDHIDKTTEAVVMAHRLAASFGLIHKRPNPAASFNALGTTATNTDGNEQKEIVIEPGMYQYAGADDDIVQVRPEHPTTSFSDFMVFLIRMAGIKLGLPLELALLDFSRTNYSSARASMEQAYRRFRIEQRIFADCSLAMIYRWRVSKWIKEGRLSDREDAWSHRWLAQPWPYLDPQKEAEGALVAIDAGFGTLSDELAKRGYQFDEWAQQRGREIKALEAAGIPISRSNKTRDAGEQPAGDTSNEQSQADED